MLALDVANILTSLSSIASPFLPISARVVNCPADRRLNNSVRRAACAPSVVRHVTERRLRRGSVFIPRLPRSQAMQVTLLKRLEARVGIEQVRWLSPLNSVQSQLPHSQARRVTGNETALKMGVFRCFVKSPGTQSLLTNESATTHPKRRCWQFCWHFCWHNLISQIRS
jgi:hypothetical protein